MCVATREGSVITLETRGTFVITQGYESARVWEEMTLDEAQMLADTLLSRIAEAREEGF